MLVRTPAAPTASPGAVGFVNVVRRWRWMLAGAALVAGLAGYVAASAGAPRYESRAVLLVGPLNVSKETLEAAGELSQTYAQLARTQTVLDATARKLRLPNVDGAVATSASSATRLLTIRAHDRNPVVAARIANTDAAQLIASTADHRHVGAGASNLRIVDAARPAAAPAGPAPAAVALLAALFGLLAAMLFAMLLDRSGDTVNGPEDLEVATGVPCIGVLSRAAMRRSHHGRPIVALEPHSRAADEYRLLAAKVAARDCQSLLVMALDGDSAVVAGNLAVALTAAGSQVALVDVTTAEAQQAREAASAENDAAHEPVTINGNGRNGHGGGVEVLPPVEVVEVGRSGPDGAREVLAGLEHEADVVLLHAPSPQGWPAGLDWARAADGTLLVTERDRTLSGDVRAAAETLQLVHGWLVGTVLTESRAVLRR
jgi:capsular polysaccharide biosynthesis protein